jgi:hypothetical protein
MNIAQAFSPGVHFSAANSSTWQTNGVAWAIGQSHGKVIAGGTFTQVLPPEGGAGTPLSTNGLAILDAESGAPDSCQLGLGSGTDTVRAITTSPDGNTVYIAGNFGSVGGVSVNRVAAIDVQACTVKSLRVSAISSTVRTLALKDNTLYMGGDFMSVAGSTRQRFAAVNATTGALLPWVANADAPGRGIGVSPDGTKVAIGGDFFAVNGAYSHSIAVVRGAGETNPGSNLKTYPSGFIHNLSATKHIFSGNDGRFYISNEGTGGGVFDGRAAFSWSTLNEVWRDTCLGATQATYEYKGTLYSASHAHNCAVNGADGFQDGRRNYLLAQDAETAALRGWEPRASDGIGEGLGPRALTVATGRVTGKDYLWVAGEFDYINGKKQLGLTRFGPDNTYRPPVPAPVAEATSEGGVQVRWRSVVDTDDSELTYEVFRNGGSTPVWTGQASSVWWNRPQVSFVDNDVSPGTTYSYRVRARDTTNAGGLSATVTAQAKTPAASYASTVRADNPDLFLDSTMSGTATVSGTWVHDVGASASDTRRLHGLALQGVAQSTDSPVAGDPTGSLRFDGSNDYVWNDDWAFAPTTYSVEAWVKTNTTRGGKIIGYGSGRPRTSDGATQTSSNYDRHIYMENNGYVRFGVNSGTLTTLRSTSALNNNQWHHIVGTQGPGGMALYVDGTRVANNSVTQAQSYRGVWHVGGDTLASSWASLPTSDYFGGLIDGAAVYGSALSAQQVTAHRNRALGTGDSTSPSTPSGLTSSVNQNDVTLSWGASTDNVGVTGYTVHRGTSPDFTVGVATKVADTNAATRTLQDQDVAANTYYYKVVARDAAGNTSAPSAAHQVNVVDSVAPTTPTNLQANVSGSNVALTWSGSSDTFGVAGYSVHRGTTAGFDATNPASKIADVTTTSYTDSSVPAGTHYYKVVAKDAANNSSAASEPATAIVDAPPAEPVTVRLNPTADSYVVSTSPTTNYGTSNQLTSRTTSPVLESFLRFSLPEAPAGTTLTGASLRVRTSTDSTAATTDATNFTVVNGAWAEDTVNWNNRPTGTGVAFATLASAPALNTAYTANGSAAALQSSLAGPVTLRATGGADNIRLWSRQGPNAASYPELTLTFTPDGTPPPSDNEAPSVPSGLNAEVTGDDVAVTWDASTDNVAVSGYSVYRGSTSDFTADAGSHLADVTSPTRAYTDNNRPAGTYHYKVIARDAAGNASAASGAVAATVTEPPPTGDPVTVRLNPTADSYVVSTSPTTNYGTNNQLTSRATSPVLESFLRFDLPAAPAGTTLTGASLRVRTSTDSSAATSDATDFTVVNGAWAEDTVTWNTRPTGTGVAFATLAAAPALNTAYTVNGSAAALESSLAGQVTLRATGGADNIRTWSRQGPGANYYPELTLTFTPTP